MDSALDYDDPASACEPAKWPPEMPRQTAPHREPPAAPLGRVWPFAAVAHPLFEQCSAPKITSLHLWPAPSRFRAESLLRPVFAAPSQLTTPACESPLLASAAAKVGGQAVLGRQQ